MYGEFRQDPGPPAKGLGWLGLRMPLKLTVSNKIDWFITEQSSAQCNILEALEPA